MNSEVVGGAENTLAGGESEKPISRESYLKAVDEAKKAKAKLKELELAEQQRFESKLKEQNEWKALAEQKEKSLQETSQRLAELETTITESVKLAAFQRHLGGKIKDDAYYSFVPVDQIVYNPETKKVDEDSVKSVVSEFVKRHSSLIEFSSGKMPNAAPKDVSFGAKAPGEMSTQELENELRKLGKI